MGVDAINPVIIRVITVDVVGALAHADLASDAALLIAVNVEFW
jgi:hypothetical protein